jgi:hypothetical protein
VIRIALVGLAAMALSGLVQAQMPAQPQANRVEGKVSALSDSSLILTKADGETETIALLPNRTVTVTAPINVDQIQPDSYVATANKSQADGTGVSIEIRVFPKEMAPSDVNRVMDAGAQTMMTNGRVARAVSIDGGRLLTVDYGAGSRQITVPPNVQVISNIPGNAAMVKVGTPVRVVTFPATVDRPARQTITVAKADMAP